MLLDGGYTRGGNVGKILEVSRVAVNEKNPFAFCFTFIACPVHFIQQFNTVEVRNEMKFLLMNSLLPYRKQELTGLTVLYSILWRFYDMLCRIPT